MWPRGHLDHNLDILTRLEQHAVHKNGPPVVLAAAEDGALAVYFQTLDRSAEWREHTQVESLRAGLAPVPVAGDIGGKLLGIGWCDRAESGG